MAETPPGERLYQRLARHLVGELSSGRYRVGDRLPPERELSQDYNISRPAVREAMIALEVQGIIELRAGSGAYVRRLPGQDDEPSFAITAFELTEARLLFEGEAAALAATHITDEEIAFLDKLIDDMRRENLQPKVTEEADREFHLAIARATRNSGIVATVEQLWRLRSTSPECALLHYKARNAQVRPVLDEHVAILDALRARDPGAARTAMRGHLAAVIEHLLFATEEQAIEAARKAVASTRARYRSAAHL